jgi:hypothetical protein
MNPPASSSNEEGVYREAASKLDGVTWEVVACMVFVLFIIGPDLPGSDDPIELCLTRMYLAPKLSFFNM